MREIRFKWIAGHMRNGIHGCGRRRSAALLAWMWPIALASGKRGINGFPFVLRKLSLHAS